MLLRNLCEPLSLNGAFTDEKVTHAMGTNPSPIQTLAFDNNLDDTG